jgi:hypothetical protein
MSLENNWFDVYFKLNNVSIIDNKFKNYFVDLEPYFQIGRETSFKVEDITEQQLRMMILDKVYEYEIC